MKYSGIKYIGRIPADWKVEPVYLHYWERKNKNDKGLENNVLSLSYGKVIEKKQDQVGGLLPQNYNSYNIVEPNDIIIRPTDLQNDKKSLRTGLVTKHGIITSAYLDLTPIYQENSEFYHYLLHSYDIKKVFYNMGNGVRQGLNYSEFSKLRLLIPPVDEQVKIVKFLNEKCNSLQKIIENKKIQIKKLREYKSSLVYEYVTGKKQVPNVGEN